MPPSLELVAPGRLRIREGGGCLSLFGLPFFGAGILMTLITVGVVPMSNEGEVPWFVWPLMVVMGLAFTAVAIKSRHGLTEFAQTLADDEICYLHALVRRALARPQHDR